LPDFPSIVARLRAAGCVFAEDEATLLLSAATSAVALDLMVHRRTGGEPLEQIVGWVAFCGLRLAVSPGVFVPRQRSEFLVRQAIAVTAPGAMVVDLCCGVGALGAALAASVPPRVLLAADIDPVAVECAQANLAGVGTVYTGDLFDALPAYVRGRVDTLMANVPYVPSAEIAWLPPEARDHEPHRALDGGPDGLAVLRRVAAGGIHWLRPGGYLLVETAGAQAPIAAEIFSRAGLTAGIVADDEEPAAIAIGRRPL
jgi:release factor glutamine methyltransferase